MLIQFMLLIETINDEIKNITQIEFFVYRVIGNIYYVYKGSSGVRVIDFCLVIILIS